ncbi:DEAD/DEAH box helicase [Pseudomonas aeruginosa]|uniref:DEAD/DEAH box helicase n=1 Tax=Pseudomonas aeruginosa TaxID=287 RepID=UPI003F2DE1F8
MYKLGKRVISQFIRTGCRRRLRLDLYRGADDRRIADAPEKDALRPGLTLLASQGREYERAKFLELEEIFPDLVVRGEDSAESERAFKTISLDSIIDSLQINQLALEVQFSITDSFKKAHGLLELAKGTGVADGHQITFEDLRPDIIQVQSPTRGSRRIVTPSGRLERIAEDDVRWGLRIIDIKIAGEPSPAHFSELAYYGMGLAGWLIDTGREKDFVVLAEAAIWPGAHDGSSMHRLRREDHAAGVTSFELPRYLAGLDADLEEMPPEVVLGRVQRFLQHDLHEVLAELNWRDLDWHIDSRCAGCDYLGYRWSRHDSEQSEGQLSQSVESDVRYCWPMAVETQHLSRVAGLSEGACGKLREAKVSNVAHVSELKAGSRVFEQHQTLRAKRTVLSERAKVLSENSAARIPSRAGTSAVLPRFSDIRVSISADFDIGSGLTFALGYRIDFGVPNASQPKGPSGPRYGRQFGTIERPMLILERALESEGATLRTWLEHLVRDILQLRSDIVAGYNSQGDADKSDVTIQFFLWDRLIFDHLCRLFSRHLDSLQNPVRLGTGKAAIDVSPISWIFPADSVLNDAAFVGRSSPITIISESVNNLLAAPIPHHYGVIDLANSLEPESRDLPDGGRWWFHVNKFYRDPLSDQIPSERGHEVWNKKSPFKDQDFQWHHEEVRKVVRKKLHAVSYVAEKLTIQLQDELSAEAPRVNDVFRPVKRLTGVGDDGQIFFQHARLMAAAQQLDIDLLMAMPPHEREARFRSARVEEVLQGGDRDRGLQELGLGSRREDASVILFVLSERSREARLKEGEYTWSFLPEVDLPALQHITVAHFKRRNYSLENEIPIEQWDWRNKLRDELKVTILKIDRAKRLLAVEAGKLLAKSVQLRLLQMDLDGAQGRFGILDPVAMDVFTSKVRKTLEEASGIRNPPLASQRPLFPVPVSTVARVQAGRPRVGSANSPVAEFIWNADVLARSNTDLPAEELLNFAEESLPGLTSRQREAVVRAGSKRLAIWWGPPGTGKSRTAQAFLIALIRQAVQAGRPLRIAVTGFTWVAIDNVARRMPHLLADAGVAGCVNLCRLCSSESYGTVDAALVNYRIPMGDPWDERCIELERRLSEKDGITLVASTVDQLYKIGGDSRCAALFDVMLIDEASQMDVAHALVGLSKLAEGASVIVVGDDKQMSPIHPYEPPKGLEHLLGSIYDFFRHYRRLEGENFSIEPIMLNRSFRSNREIVEFVREAGYGEDLDAAEANADLRISTVQPIATVQPDDWPENLPFSPSFARILDAEEPLAAVIHNDRYSSQRNDAEADLVAGLVLALFRAGLRNLNDPGLCPYDPNGFFRHGVGIVTPHRAQQAAVFDRLAAVLPPEIDRNLVFSSIDTVERFQGQEKAVMLASFGLGDMDQISAEEQFLYSLNRFNVTASRAQAKFIAIISRPLVDHLPRDRRALEESRLLKYFVDGFLERSVRIELPTFGICDLKLH